MTDKPEYVIDASVHEALGKYFHGVTPKKLIGDCSILVGIRKQNGAMVDIYVPSYAASREDATPDAIAKQFAAYEKLNRRDLQAAVRCFTSRTFRNSPALAMLSCRVDVLDDAFDTLPPTARLATFVHALEALAALHEAGIVHGSISDKVLRREDAQGPMRLCDTGFSGGRQTTVVEQPVAYQTRKVVNTSQPDFVDDVYAAGMLGYRMLLGPNGPERVLTGKLGPVDSERVTAAILADDRPPLNGSELFPEGHESAEQIARVLARMVGKLPNAEPYSTAKSALAAIRSVIENPGANEVEMPKPMVAPAKRASAAATVRSGGLSRTASAVMVCAAVVMTCSTVYFQQRANTLEGAFASAATKVGELHGEVAALQAEKTRFDDTIEAVITAANELRRADTAVLSADMVGAAHASKAVEAELGQAKSAHAVAEAAFIEGDWTRTGTASDAARIAAERAASSVSELRIKAKNARTKARQLVSAAERASGRPDAIPSSIFSQLADASSEFEGKRFTSAEETWREVAEALDGIVAKHKQAAMEARSKAETQRAMSSVDADASNVRGLWLFTRGEQAFSAGAYAEAAAVFRRAGYTLAKADDEAIVVSVW